MQKIVQKSPKYEVKNGQVVQGFSQHRVPLSLENRLVYIDIKNYQYDYFSNRGLLE